MVFLAARRKLVKKKKTVGKCSGHLGSLKKNPKPRSRKARASVRSGRPGSGFLDASVGQHRTVRTLSTIHNLVAFSRAFARFSFATVSKTKFTRPPGHTMWIFQKKKLEHREKKVGISPRECVFRNQRGRFSPLGVQNKGVMEKGLIFDEKC